MDHYTPFGNSDSPEKPEETPTEAVSSEPDAMPPTTTEAEPVDQPTQAEYLRNIMPPAKPKSNKLWVVLIVLVVLVLAGGGAAYYLLRGHKTPAPAHKSNGASTVVPAANSGNSSLTHYVSNGNDLNLDFDYPASWSVAPASNNNSSDQTITVTSPVTRLPSATGSDVTGRVVVFIRPGSATLSELTNGATVAQASAQMAYTKPTTAQHQYPYLTFLHLGNGSSNTFQEVIVTGTLQFPAGTSINNTSINVDPVISANFYTCTAQSCTGSTAVPLSITNGAWQDTPLMQQTLALFESMQLN